MKELWKLEMGELWKLEMEGKSGRIMKTVNERENCDNYQNKKWKWKNYEN